jgi:hypothetical protein
MTTAMKVKTKRGCIAELEARGFHLQQGRHSRDGRQWWNTFRVMPRRVWDNYTDGLVGEKEIERRFPQVAYRKCDKPDWPAILELAGEDSPAKQ